MDPGRVHLICAYDTVYDKYYQFSRKQYYQESGMTSRFQRKQKRMLAVRHIHQQLSLYPVRSISVRDWHLHQQTITNHYDELWRVHTAIADRRDDFRVHSLKQSTINQFLSKFIVKGDKPIIAYGAASMNPTGKGELSVPVKHIFKTVEQRFVTYKENEEYSTKMHFKCQSCTQSVSAHDGCKVRGLRWCPTCRELIHRDKNACRNIALSFQSDDRPKYLCRAFHTNDPKLPLWTLGRPTRRAGKEIPLPLITAFVDKATSVSEQTEDWKDFVGKWFVRKNEQPLSDII